MSADPSTPRPARRAEPSSRSDVEREGEVEARPPASSASDEMCRALLEGMLDPVIAINGSGIIRMASQSVTNVFGYSSAELIGRNIKFLMPEPHGSAHDEYLANYARTGKTHILNATREFEIVRKDGAHVAIELSVARVDPPDGGPPLFIGSFRDISERERARRSETSMLRALANLGRSAAMLAHEIKNPITSINLALRAVADQLGEDHQAVLEDLSSHLRRLELQMRQTLSYARALDLRRTACDVEELCADVERSMRPVLDHAGVTLELALIAGTPAVDADPLRLEEVLTNLVSNACEALDQGGRVRISAYGEHDRVVLRVEDDGPGIAASIAATLFDPFVTTKAQGTGLGLSICRRVIEEHGGSLVARPDSELGGACFEIRLAAQPAES